MMTNEESIFINKIAQNIITIDEGICWYNNHTNQEDILMTLIYYIQQGGGVSQHVEEYIVAIIESTRLKETATPIMMLKSLEQKQVKGTSALVQVLKKYIYLPTVERQQACKVLFAMLSFLYRQNRSNINGNKWWLSDLSKN